jgi:hypothetical protein
MSLLQFLFGGKTVSQKLLEGILTSERDDEYGCVVAWINCLAGQVTADMWISSKGVQFFERRSLSLPVREVDPLDRSKRIDDMAEVINRVNNFDGRSFHGNARDGEVLSVYFRTPNGHVKIDARGYCQNPEYAALSRFLLSEGDKWAEVNK